jgi:hypothetical protein
MSNVRHKIFDNEQTLSSLGKNLEGMQIAPRMGHSKEKSHNDCIHDCCDDDDPLGVNNKELRNCNNRATVDTIDSGILCVPAKSSSLLDINCIPNNIDYENSVGLNINCSGNNRETNSNSNYVVDNDSTSRVGHSNLVIRRRKSSAAKRERRRYINENREFVEEETVNLLSFSDQLNLFVGAIPEKGRRTSPYSTRKIANMWRAFIPPTIERLCCEVTDDGWSANYYNLLNISAETVAKLRPSLQTDIPGSKSIIERIDNMGYMRISYSETIPLKNMNNVKYAVFWECYLYGFFKRCYNLRCYVVVIY